MKKFLIGASLLVAMSAHAKTADKWSLMEIDGDHKIIQVLHDLSRHECDFVKARIEGNPATPEEAEAKRKKDAEYAFNENVADHKWDDFKEAHNCKVIGGDILQTSEVKDGACFRGEDMMPPGWNRVQFWPTRMLLTAECFQ